jgi:PST family polysaccharide transporter
VTSGKLSARMAHNLLAQYVTHGTAYVVPLIATPYLLRTLGIEAFGKLMYATSFLAIARVLVNYGFDLTAARQAAIIGATRNKELSALAIDIIFSRILIWFVLFISSVTLFPTGDSEYLLKQILVCLMFVLLGEALFPAWLFQALEDNKVLAGIKLISRLGYLLLLLCCVRSERDLLLVPLSEAAMSLVAGSLAIVVATRKYELMLVRPAISRITEQLKDGFSVFLSNASVQLYTNGNAVMLGAAGSARAVAEYAIADRVYSAIRGMLNPLVQVMFPIMARLEVESQEQLKQLRLELTRKMSVVLVVLAVLLIAVSGKVIFALTGEHSRNATLTLIIFSISLPFAWGSLLAPMLVARRRSSYLLKITVLGGAIGAILGPMFIWWAGSPGAGLSFLFVQIYNSVALNRAHKALDQQVQTNIITPKRSD